jgi:two-component system response regulator PilR (NtrC family)
MTARLLIVDDEESMLEFLRLLFEDSDYDLETADSVRGARALLEATTPDVILCDYKMPDGTGLELLDEIKQRKISSAVILMTAHGTHETAVEAMRLGAYDYVAKPFDVNELKLLVAKALEKAELIGENARLRQELAQRYTFGNIIGRSPQMQAVFELVQRVADTGSTVLLSGESGTGKELVARAIHFESQRAKGPFLTINCGAMPETLLESELFGHEKGAFTGAHQRKDGLFQAANGGTLLLDEIGEMPQGMQVKLLRVLQEKTVRKVGGTREEDVDVRIIASTNRELQEQVDRGEFREDLFYRIQVIPIRLPSLRERREDIPLLIEHFLRRHNDHISGEPRRISPGALKILEGYDWPGNVRELENAIERAVTLSTDELITVQDLPPQLHRRQPSIQQRIEIPAGGLDLEGLLDDQRRNLMLQALERTGGVQTQAAELLGMSFRSFRYYAKKLGIKGGNEALDESAESETTDEPAASPPAAPN